MSGQAGRTSWWPCDAAEHDRELVVELGEEFGPAAHAVTRILKDLAQQQRADGAVRSGFRVIAGKTHLGIANDDPRAEARQIIERAAAIGYLDDLRIDDDGRRFSCRVSGWEADQRRGRETLKKAAQRAEDGDSGVPRPRDKSPQDGTCPPNVPLPHQTIPNQTREEAPTTPHAVVAQARSAGGLSQLVDSVLTILRGCRRFTVDDISTRTQVENALAACPAENEQALAAANVAVVWASDAAWRKTNAGAVFLDALRKEVQRGDDSRSGGASTARPEHPAERRDRELAALAERLEAEKRAA